MGNSLYSFVYRSYSSVQNIDFQLHEHNEYEIYMFFEGDAKYIVENKNYTLSHGDVIIIRKNEMHRVFHNSPAAYSSFVLSVSPQFFPENNCPEYEEAFINKNYGNKINSEIVHSSGLYDSILRLKKYSEGGADSPVVKAVVIEICYLINKISSFEAPYFTNLTTKEVINYINSNFRSEITLDSLCKRFYISKYYLCRIFKQATGLTVQEYIRQKRLTFAYELKKEGKTLSEAAVAAGFTSYSSFYRSYMKKYSKTPKEMTDNK